jgi:ABC-type transporter Mla MlaB component
MVWERRGSVPVTVLHLRGDLNAASYEQLQLQAQRQIDSGVHYLVLDLSEVPYVSSAGIGAMTHLFHAMRTDAPEDSDAAIRAGMKAGTYRSPHLKLACPRPRVHEILKLAGVPMFLEVHTDLQVVIESFK